jgi:zinc transport system substrate-binding protein
MRMGQSLIPTFGRSVGVSFGALIGLTLALSIGLAGCSPTGQGSSGGSTGESGAGSSPASPDKPTIVAAFYPLGYAAAQIAGDRVNVIGLTPPGVEPHDLELTAAQTAQIAEADLVLYAAGFQPAVDEAVDQQASDRAIDVLVGLELLAGHDEAGHDEAAPDGATDPHVWLDPNNMTAIGSAIADRLASIDPSGAADYAEGATALAGQMSELDSQYRTGLANCAITTLVVSHEAFGYLAQAYGLQQVGISGLSPEAEPSPARMADVISIVRSKGVSTLYYETLVDPKVAATIASEAGITTSVLDPLEGLADGSADTYVTVMQRNLQTLIDGQRCT